MYYYVVGKEVTGGTLRTVHQSINGSHMVGVNEFTGGGGAMAKQLNTAFATWLAFLDHIFKTC